MAETFTRFDAADYLKTDEDIAAYPEAAAEDGDYGTIATAFGTVAGRTAGANSLRECPQEFVQAIWVIQSK